MSGTKPLIFVHPLSDSLKKLKEVIAETADEDGVEIYEVDDVMEVSQLLPSIVFSQQPNVGESSLSSAFAKSTSEIK